ncbi:hypothetical protein [Halovivax ruber]|uniref:hypothetical protein n=1 Tax=Halovivax ruber TaxID=387341 RepID=UPI0011E541C0|nr:hypothetical protein [Halovivax ruber]
MNRRTLLAGAGGISAFGLVGYFIYTFSLSMPILLNGKNETDSPKGVVVTVTELDSNRKNIDTPVSIPVGATTEIGRVPNADSQASVKLVELAADGEEGPDEDAVIDEATELLGPETKQLTITVTDDGLDLDLSLRE